MRDKICLLILVFTVTYLHAQTQDSMTISYTIDTIASPTCYQSTDGAILLDDVKIPGTIDRYEWSNGSDNEDLIFINGGEFQLTVYNTEGTSYKTEMFIVPEPDTLVISEFISPPTAPELNNGFVNLTINGGTSPFRLTMIFNQDTATVTIDSTFTLADVDTGIYKFSVLDANGCTDTSEINVPAIGCGILATALVEPAECAGSPTGRIELVIENAIEPYTIDWDSGNDNQRVRNRLSAGIYGFTIRDRRRCTISDSIEIVNEDRIPPEAIVNDDILLYLNQNGKAVLLPRQIIFGAKDDCSEELGFQLEQSEFTCQDVGINEIDFYITDDAGNTTTKPIQVEVRDTQAIKLIYQDTVYTALCNGIAQYSSPQVQGSCSTTTSGGVVKATNREITSPGIYEDRYYYIKSPDDTLKANVTVIVADTRVRAFLIVEEPRCSTGDDGSVAVALRNSKTPVSYQWNDGSDQDFIFGIVNQKKYTVTVKEGNGCVFELSAVTNGPDSLQVKLQNLVEKEDKIDIIAQVGGGNNPLRYDWYNQGEIISNSRDLINVEDGKIYQLLVTDALGCTSKPLIVDRIMTASINDLEHQIDLFPNPVDNTHLTIRFKQGVENYKLIRIMNSQLQVMKEFNDIHSDVKLSIESYPPGIYFIQFFNKGGGIFSKKFIRM